MNQIRAFIDAKHRVVDIEKVRCRAQIIGWHLVRAQRCKHILRVLIQVKRGHVSHLRCLVSIFRQFKSLGHVDVVAANVLLSMYCRCCQKHLAISLRASLSS